MTKITNEKLYRKNHLLAGGGLVARKDVIPPPQRLKTTLNCSGQEFLVYVSLGEFVNKKKRCKRLLAGLND